ncbi:MAG: DoxX family protein [Gammaproteobacteria bacterium]|nr:DoxX family protein [Gammaproteobacteria bacterium]
MILSSLNAGTGRLILRIGLGALLLFHGIAKILHPASLDFIGGMLVANNLPSVLAYGVYVGEVIAPMMVIVGYYTRIGGLLIAVNMTFALFLVHSDEWLRLTEHGGSAIELQLFYLISALAMVFLGSGKYAYKQD